MRKRKHIEEIAKQYRRYIPTLFGEVRYLDYNSEYDNSQTFQVRGLDKEHPEFGFKEDSIYNVYPTPSSRCVYNFTFPDNCFIIKYVHQEKDTIKWNDTLAIVVIPYDKAIRRLIETHRQTLNQLSLEKNYKEQCQEYIDEYKELIRRAPTPSYSKFLKYFPESIRKEFYETDPELQCNKRELEKYQKSYSKHCQKIANLTTASIQQHDALMKIWNKEKDALLKHVYI